MFGQSRRSNVKTTYSPTVSVFIRLSECGFWAKQLLHLLQRSLTAVTTYDHNPLMALQNAHAMNPLPHGLPCVYCVHCRGR